MVVLVHFCNYEMFIQKSNKLYNLNDYSKEEYCSILATDQIFATVALKPKYFPLCPKTHPETTEG